VRSSHKVNTVFDDPNLMSAAGLIPVLRLAESAGLHKLVGTHVSVDCPNPVAKTTGVVAGMLAGADCIDDTIREVHGYTKQGAAFGYSGVRGLNAQIAAVSTPLTAPVIAAARLRRGNVSSAAGVGRLLTQAINTARAAGVTGQIMNRADSAYYGTRSFPLPCAPRRGSRSLPG